jgi:GT2 family glycosyltransferase
MNSVTAAIPCFNGAPYIQRCIEAVLSQSRPPDKVLVIDDGSTDESAQLAAAYPIQLIQHGQNRGLSAARNTALAHTETDILAFVDADAYADQHMLEKLMAEFTQNDACGAGGRGIEAVQNNIYDRWRSLHASQGHGAQRLESCEHLFGLCMAYQRKALEAVGGFDTSFRTNGEDMDIGFRLNSMGQRLVYTPDALVYHQRKDNHASIRRMMYQWYYWAFIAKQKNGRNPWSLLVGTLRRLVWSDTLKDLLARQSVPLMLLDIELAMVKMQAILSAANSGRASGNQP